MTDGFRHHQVLVAVPKHARSTAQKKTIEVANEYHATALDRIRRMNLFSADLDIKQEPTSLDQSPGSIDVSQMMYSLDSGI